MEVIAKLRTLDRWALPLGVLGLTAVAWHNWRLWQRDKILVAARGRPEPLPNLETWPTLPKVSVLVAAWNEAAHIERHIRSVLALTYPHKELILCAGGDDGTFDLAQRFVGPKVIVLEQQPGEGKQRALRRCLEQVSGAVIYLTDADCELDDEVFQRTCQPVVAGTEHVCTGGARPFTELLDRPFVLLQVAAQIYHDLQTPPYGTGLLGRNCAVERILLERSHGLDASATTGTDYVLAKKLLQAGARIRQIPESRVATSYPTSVAPYIRQQDRWLRNIVLHGPRFAAFDEVRTSLVTSLIGISMLLTPIGVIVFGPNLFVIWFAGLAYAFLSRLRYLYVASAVFNRPVGIVHLALEMPMIFIDFFTWSQSLFSHRSIQRRELW